MNFWPLVTYDLWPHDPQNQVTYLFSYYPPTLQVWRYLTWILKIFRFLTSVTFDIWPYDLLSLTSTKTVHLSICSSIKTYLSSSSSVTLYWSSSSTIILYLSRSSTKILYLSSSSTKIYDSDEIRVCRSGYLMLSFFQTDSCTWICTM